MVERAEERRQKSRLVDFPAAKQSDIHVETRVNPYWGIGLPLGWGSLKSYTREYVWDHSVLSYESLVSRRPRGERLTFGGRG
jgi:hypothetical protein